LNVQSVGIDKGDIPDLAKVCQHFNVFMIHNIGAFSLTTRVQLPYYHDIGYATVLTTTVIMQPQSNISYFLL